MKLPKIASEITPQVIRADGCKMITEKEARGPKPRVPRAPASREQVFLVFSENGSPDGRKKWLHEDAPPVLV